MLMELPDDLLGFVLGLSLLTTRDVVRGMLVSRRWRQLCKQHSAWGLILRCSKAPVKLRCAAASILREVSLEDLDLNLVSHRAPYEEARQILCTGCRRRGGSQHVPGGFMCEECSALRAQHTAQSRVVNDYSRILRRYERTIAAAEGLMKLNGSSDVHSVLMNTQQCHHDTRLRHLCNSDRLAILSAIIEDRSRGLCSDWGLCTDSRPRGRVCLGL